MEIDQAAEHRSGPDVASESGSQSVTPPVGRPAWWSKPAMRTRLMVADATAILVGGAVAFWIQRVSRPVPRFVWVDHLTLFMLSAPCFVIGASLSRMYLARANERPSQEWANIARTVAIGVGAMVALAFVLQYKTLSRFWVSLIVASVTVALIVEREVARRIFRQMRCSGRLSRRIVIVGTDAHAVGLMHAFQRRPDLGYQVVGFVGDDDIGVRGGVERLGGFDDTLEMLRRHEAVGVVVSLGSVDADTANRMTRQLTDAGYHTALSTSLRDIDVGRIRPQEVDGQTLMYVEPVIRTGWRAHAKRVFDVVTAATVLIVTAPVLAVAAIAIKLDSPGPVFFRQRRVGHEGEPFELVKLRTMTLDADARKAGLLDLNEADGPLFKIRDDPRVTRVGSFLRRYSIDELPQLVSVLRGSMSLVGPRPALPDEVSDWDIDVHERLRVLPGITGIWQVSGRSDTSFEEYKRFDLYYVDNWSLAHDLRICAKTVGAVLGGRGAS